MLETSLLVAGLSCRISGRTASVTVIRRLHVINQVHLRSQFHYPGLFGNIQAPFPGEIALIVAKSTLRLRWLGYTFAGKRGTLLRLCGILRNARFGIRVASNVIERREHGRRHRFLKRRCATRRVFVLSTAWSRTSGRGENGGQAPSRRKGW